MANETVNPIETDEQAKSETKTVIALKSIDGCAIGDEVELLADYADLFVAKGVARFPEESGLSDTSTIPSKTPKTTKTPKDTLAPGQGASEGK